MKGRRAKKGAVLATAVVFMTIIIALSVLVVVFASSSTKRAVNAAKRANSSIEADIIGDEFVTAVKNGYEKYNDAANGSEIRELPVATIDAHMNEFVGKINENYSCEVSVSASKTYSLKLIETSGEKETQIMLVSVNVNEDDGNCTYSVVKWNTTSQTVEELNAGEELADEHIMKLAKKFLQLYSEDKDGNVLLFAMSRYIQNFSDLNGEKFSNDQYSIVTERNAYGDEIYYSVICKKDDAYKVILKYNIVYADNGDPSFVIYDSGTSGETLKKKYGFVVYDDKTDEEQDGIYCVVYPYDDNDNVINESTSKVTTTTETSEEDKEVEAS